MDHEYRIRVTNKEGGEHVSPVSSNPKITGENYKRNREQLQPGETVELQKRVINPWETVEKISK